MKIAILPLGHRALPTGGSTIFAPGVLASRAAEELQSRGHQVVVYAPKDSTIKANTRSFDLASMFSQYKEIREKDPVAYLNVLFKYELFNASSLVEESHLYDIIHAHDYRKIMYFSHLLKCPIVYTYHGSPQDDCQKDIDLKVFHKYYNNNFFIAASQRQVDLGKKFLNFAGVVHHGVDINKIPFKQDPFEEMLFVGRLMKRKRPDIAIEIARRLDKKIRIIGEKYHTTEDTTYFEEILKPLLKLDNVIFEGIIPYPDIYKSYSQGKVCVMPIEWEEPFGMVMIEAMAAGTPVVAFKMGSVPEIIRDGVTGFISPPGDIDHMTKVIKKIYEMSPIDYQKMRYACRKHVEENFTISKMVDGYEDIYNKILKN